MTNQDEFNARLEAVRPICPVCRLPVGAAYEAEIEWEGESAIAHGGCSPTACDEGAGIHVGSDFLAQDQFCQTDCGALVWLLGSPRDILVEDNGSGEYVACPECGYRHYATGGTFESEVEQ